MKPEDYIGKQVIVGPNDEGCPQGTFKCVGVRASGRLELEDPDCIDWPWEISVKYVRVDEMERKDAKIGQQVKVTGSCIHGARCHKFDGKIGIIDSEERSYTGDLVAFIRWPGEEESNLVDYKYLEPVADLQIDDRAKVARILTEKIMVDGHKCRKILGFEGILGSGELPAAYLGGMPRFYRVGGNRLHGHFEVVKGTPTWICPDRIRAQIYVDIPSKGEPKIDIGGYDLLLTEGDIWLESTFQDILIWMKRAGARLAKIRKAERLAWPGKEDVEI